MAASSNGLLAEALGEFSLTSLSRPICLSMADPASDWGGLSQATRGPADWSQLSRLSAVERGILNSSVMLTGARGVGEGLPECRGGPQELEQLSKPREALNMDKRGIQPHQSALMLSGCGLYKAWNTQSEHSPQKTRTYCGLE